MGSTLISGALGFVGSHFVNQLQTSDKVICVTRDKTELAHLDSHPRAVWVFGDVSNPVFVNTVMAEYGVTSVFHFAAQAKVKTAFKDPYSVYRSNVLGLVTLLDAARRQKVNEFFFLQSDKVYGDQHGADTQAPIKASEPYGTSKACQALIAESFRETYGMKIMELRSCNIYGYDPNSDRVIPNTIKECISGVDPVVYTDDSSERQYLHVNDVISAILYITEYLRVEQVYNVASPKVYTQLDVTAEILKHFPERKPRYKQHPGFFQVQSNSLKTTMPRAWEPKISFEEGIKRTIEEFRELGW
jgi:dTDP-glucose 4,6-dehydratase